jgi:predicted CopG family antitoxin
MPTAKKRINLAVEDGLYEELEKLRQIKGAPSLSSIVLELTKEALELQEDLYFVKIAAERDSEEILSHEDIWKKK